MAYDLLLVMADREYADNPASNTGQGCICAYVKQSGFSARLFSGNPTDTWEVVSRKLRAGETGLVGFYLCEQNMPVVQNLVARVKELGAVCLVGGPQTIGVDEAGLRALGCDYIIDGEGEVPVERLLRFLLRGEGGLESIPGLRYIDADGQYHADTPAGEPPQDLDAIGHPLVSDIITTGENKRLTIPVLTGRGCPFRCSFCYEGAHAKQVRLRSVENVMEEIDYWKAQYESCGIVVFMDDTFTLDIARALRIARELKRRGMYFFCEGHVQVLHRHPEVIRELVDNGLVVLQVGIESGSTRVLEAYNKAITPDMIRQVVANAKEAGVPKMFGNFIIGGALEGKDTFAQSKRLACELIETGRGMLELNAVYFAPYPRTPMSAAPCRYGMTLLADQQEYTLASMYNCVNETSALTRNEITACMAEFRQSLDEAYRRATRALTRTELQYYYTNYPKVYTGINKVWRDYQSNETYMVQFLKKGFRYTDVFDEDAVMVRTFSDLRYDGRGALCIAGRRFTGAEKQFLERATGRYTMNEMAAGLGGSPSEAWRIFSRLNEACLVYRDPV